MSRIEAGTFPRQVIMAERIQVELVDDIDGSRAQQTVTFALDGIAYEIDLSERHAQQLRSVFEPYIEHARTPERTSRTTRQQEREERRARQANRQLTEQIRGAAQRSRERLSQQARDKEPAEQDSNVDAAVEEEVPAPQEETILGDRHSASERETEPPDEQRVPAVALPQFSSAAD
ncbi:Lsr2 protein [Halopolyspora algeriensis]|uniref:Lsr2 protein n=1 Tax=Halopolyspora algeriensis TaxID=1500506 RepID=A0A368VN34_9ACTN|nr:Lsr2 family protein [Halopolyspora algeriensis]RCW42938.1 Lsr2 protein [Halopolyspora algeriensis]TQM56593.1 Lsr2 protein [Halopolyspora algeriensis]